MLLMLRLTGRTHIYLFILASEFVYAFSLYIVNLELSLDGTLTVTLIRTLRPTLALLGQRLYRTSEAPLKLLHVYYNLTIYVLHTNR